MGDAGIDCPEELRRLVARVTHARQLGCTKIHTHTHTLVYGLASIAVAHVDVDVGGTHENAGRRKALKAYGLLRLDLVSPLEDDSIMRKESRAHCVRKTPPQHVWVMILVRRAQRTLTMYLCEV